MSSSLSLEDKQSILKISKWLGFAAFVLFCLLSISPLIGLFIPVNMFQITTLFETKAWITKGICLGLLGIAVFDFLLRMFIYGPKLLLETFIKNPWNLLFTILIIWSFVSCFQGSIAKEDSSYLDRSFNGYAFVFEGWTGYLAYAGAFAGASMLCNKKHRAIIFDVFIAASFTLAVFTFAREQFNWEFIINRSGLCNPYSSVFINSNHYAYYLSIATILCIAKFLYNDTLQQKIIYGIAGFVNLCVLLLNQTLGGYFAVLVGILFICIFALVKKEKNLLFYILGTLTIVIVMSFILGGSMVSKELPDLFMDFGKIFSILFNAVKNGEDIIGTAQSLDFNRISIWAKSFDLFRKNMLFGVGTDLESIGFKQNFGQIMVAHNEYMHIGACTGLIGFLSYFGGVVTLIIYSIINVKKMPSTYYISAICMGTFAISAIFGITLPLTDCFFFMMLGMTNAWFQRENEIKIIKESL